MRLGPRPLPLHLMAATTTLMSSRFALPALKNGSLPWNPALAAAAAALRDALEKNHARDDAFAEAVGVASARRLAGFLAGVSQYHAHAYRRRVAEPPAVWSAGGSRLLDYGADAPDSTTGSPVILVVPSLVNRAYILDLTEKRSLMRHLAGAGMRPMLMDWGEPSPEDSRLTLDDYIAVRLDGALDYVLAHTGGPVVLLGYCMGGLLALALALRRARNIAGLALMATPWDFHADNPDQSRTMAAIMAPQFAFYDGLGVMPVDVLQTLFAALDPTLTLRKFRAFAALDPASSQARKFVALEDWVNDGVPLAAAVARECLIGWYGENRPARDAWMVAGEAVVARDLRMPTLLLIPEHDRIVPPASARALATAIPGARSLTPKAGHIGMVVGSRAKTEVWAPLTDWLGAVGGG